MEKKHWSFKTKFSDGLNNCQLNLDERNLVCNFRKHEFKLQDESDIIFPAGFLATRIRVQTTN